MTRLSPVRTQDPKDLRSTTTRIAEQTALSVRGRMTASALRDLQIREASVPLGRIETAATRPEVISVRDSAPRVRETTDLQIITADFPHSVLRASRRALIETDRAVLSLRIRTISDRAHLARSSSPSLSFAHRTQMLRMQREALQESLI